MVVPIDLNKRGLNSFVFNTNRHARIRRCTEVYSRRRTSKSAYETAYRCHLRVTLDLCYVNLGVLVVYLEEGNHSLKGTLTIK